MIRFSNQHQLFPYLLRFVRDKMALELVVGVEACLGVGAVRAYVRTVD